MYLCYNTKNSRYGIRKRNGEWENPGIHCGDAIDVIIEETFETVRIEYSRELTHSHGWYAFECPDIKLDGMPAKEAKR